MIRGWPPIGLTGLILLGLVVGKGSTPLDDWFFAVGERYPWLGRLLVFTDGRVILALWAVVLATVLIRRRWRPAAVVAVAPVVAVFSARFAKSVFGRFKGDSLAYPSGHTTLAVVVLGLCVLIAGAGMWSVVAALLAALLGVLGQAVTYHYFTDAIGAMFLGTALVCAAAWAGGLDRCQPRCDLDHSSS